MFFCEKKVYCMNFRAVNCGWDISEWQDENSDLARAWFRIQKNCFKIQNFLINISSIYCNIADWFDLGLLFLANVNSSSCSLYVIVGPSVVCRLSVVCLSVCRLSSVVCRLSSVVCDVRAPYSDDWNFPQCFYAIGCVGHLLTSRKNFTKIVPGEPLRRGS